MKCAKLSNWHDFWNRRNKSPGSDMDSGYTGNRDILCVRLTIQLKEWSLVLEVWK